MLNSKNLTHKARNIAVFLALFTVTMIAPVFNPVEAVDSSTSQKKSKGNNTGSKVAEEADQLADQKAEEAELERQKQVNEGQQDLLEKLNGEVKVTTQEQQNAQQQAEEDKRLRLEFMLPIANALTKLETTLKELNEVKAVSYLSKKDRGKFYATLKNILNLKTDVQKKSLDSNSYLTTYDPQIVGKVNSALSDANDFIAKIKKQIEQKKKEEEADKKAQKQQEEQQKPAVNAPKRVLEQERKDQKAKEQAERRAKKEAAQAEALRQKQEERLKKEAGVQENVNAGSDAGSGAENKDGGQQQNEAMSDKTVKANNPPRFQQEVGAVEEKKEEERLKKEAGVQENVNAEQKEESKLDAVGQQQQEIVEGKQGVNEAMSESTMKANNYVGVQLEEQEAEALRQKQEKAAKEALRENNKVLTIAEKTVLAPVVAPQQPVAVASKINQTEHQEANPISITEAEAKQKEEELTKAQQPITQPTTIHTSTTTFTGGFTPLKPEQNQQIEKTTSQQAEQQNLSNQQNQTNQQDVQQGGAKTLTVSEFLQSLGNAKAENGVMKGVKKSISDIKTLSALRKFKNELNKLMKGINPTFRPLLNKKPNKAAVARRTKQQNQWIASVKTWLNKLNQSDQSALGLTIHPTDNPITLALSQRKPIINAFSALLKDLNQQNTTIIKANRAKKLAKQEELRAKKKTKKAEEKNKGRNRRRRIDTLSMQG